MTKLNYLIILSSDPKKKLLWWGNSGGHNGLLVGRDGDNKMNAQKGKFFLKIRMRLINKNDIRLLIIIVIFRKIAKR